MKITIYTHYTNPEERRDPWKEALASFEEIADEIIVVGNDWPDEFRWDYIGKVFQEGFDQSNGDWVINMPIDNLFHENDAKYIKDFIFKHKDKPAIAFPKRKIFTPDRYEIKTRDVLAMNKKDFPNIMLNGGGDLCLPTLNGVEIKANDVPNAKAPLWNYDTVFRTKEIIKKDRKRFANAWFSYFGTWDDRGGASEEEAYNAWFNMVKERYPYHVFKLNINEHPKFIQNKLLKLSQDQFGYSAFGLKESSKSTFKHYLESYKKLFLY